MQFSKEQCTKDEWREFKRTGKVPARFIQESPPVIEQPQPITKIIHQDNALVTVLCVKFGPKYDRTYVEKLRNMVSRHLTVPYEFVCLTDDHTQIEGVISKIIPHQRYERGWWHKVHMFDPTLNLKGRILYFDLDVIIHSNIDRFVTSYKKEFLGIRDFNRKFHKNWNIMNSSVMSWPAGLHPDIFYRFTDDPKKAMKLHGDQDWIWQVAKSRIQWWPEQWIQSYKWEIRDRSELIYNGGKRMFKDVKNQVAIPNDCSVCVFHGEPNPHDIKDKYVLDNWR